MAINNIFREIHGSPKLKLNLNLCKDANNWAKHLAVRGNIDYDMQTSQGQNIYSVCKDDDAEVPIQEALIQW